MSGIFALAALGLIGAQVAQRQIELAPFYFNEESLGKGGFEAFENPDSLTIQRVYPVRASVPRSAEFGRWNLNSAGPEHEVSGKYLIIEALKQRQRMLHSLCVMHPDHILRFKKREVVVSVVTCYTCHFIDVSVNDKFIGRTTMPGGQPMSDLRGYIPLDEDCRARWDEILGEGFFDTLRSASGATFQRVDLGESSSFRPTIAHLGEAKQMALEDVIELRTLIAYSVRIEAFFFNSFGVPRASLATDVLVTFETTDPIQVVFRKGAFKGHPLSWKDKRDFFQQGDYVREAAFARLKRMSEGG